jgi:hypothetical protein
MPPTIPGFNTIVRFLAIEKFNKSDTENTKPDTPNMINKR